MRITFIRGSVRVAPIVDKMRENRSKCFGRVTRRGESEAMRVAMEINVETRRR